MATYVDTLGGIAEPAGYKAPCVAATTGDLGTGLTGLLTIDGVTLTPDARVLVWQQADQTTNGIYNANTGAWTLAVDFSSSSSILQGTQVFVTGGTSYGNTAFQCLTSNPVLGVTPIEFTEVDNVNDGFFNSLPTTLPATSGVVWNNKGSICIS